MNTALAIGRLPKQTRAARFGVALLSLLLSATNAVAGDDLRIDWSTLDSGGGSASGGNYELVGTIGQLDADPLQPSSGGNFQLIGGFWVVDVAPASEGLFSDGFEQF